MPERLLMARLFLTTGGLLAVAGLTLWLALHIPSFFPPYFFTVLLALGYGLACRMRRLFPVLGKP